MQFLQIDQNKSGIFKKPQGKLVIRVHMNLFEETNPLKKVYLKEKKTAKSKPKSKSIARKRSTSIKMFANAHKADQKETFLTSKKMKKSLPTQKANKIFNNLKQSQNLSQKRGRTIDNNLQQNGTKSLLMASIKERQLKFFIDKVHKSVMDKVSPPKDVMSDLSKIIYGEEGAYWQDRSFEFIEQSSIECEDDCFFLEVGEF